jgi:hypothetical protein
VLGSIGGNSAFDTFTALGSRFNASLMNETLQRIRKNVSLLTRNISDTLSNTSFDGTTSNTVGNKLFYINKGTALKTLKYSNIPTIFPTPGTDSLILIGGDLIIDADIINTYAKAKGIIVLKNEA